MASTSRWTRWLAFLLVVQLTLAEISIRNVYVEQVIVVTNGTSVPTLRTQISVSCNSGDSQFFTSIINSSLTNVMITCSPTQIIQSVIQERWASQNRPLGGSGDIAIDQQRAALLCDLGSSCI